MRVITGDNQTELRDIGAIHAEMTAALQALKEADASESAARNHATDCRNTVNRLQKQLSAAIADIQNAAPRDTDWGQQRQNASARAGG
jgi:hypothetical protein